MLRRSLLVLAALLGGGPAVAEGPASLPPPRVEMTFAEAIARAEASPDLVVARAVQAVAERSIDVVSAPLAPGLTAASHSVTASLALSLSVPIRWGGQRGAALDVARSERDAAAAETGAAAGRAREEAAAAWIRLAAQADLERLAAARVERLERTAGAVQQLFDAGRVARVDLAKAKAEVASARADVFTVAAERRAAGAALAFLVGLPPDAEVVAAGDRPTPVRLAELPALLARVPGTPELRAADARGRASEARIRRAKREGLPALTLEGGADFNDPTVEGTDKHLALGLSIPVGARAVLGVSSAERDRDAAERARLLRSIEAEVVATWGRLEASRRRLEALQSSTIPAAREAAELAGVAYREGRSDLLRLLESERALGDVEAGRVEAWAAWGTQHASLERLVGGWP